MPTQSGARGTGNVLAANTKPDVKEAMALLEPSATPLVQFTLRIPAAPAHNPEFKWFEDALRVRSDAINNVGGYTTSATSLVVDDGTKFAADDIVKVSRTGENLRVTAVATNTLTVVRGSTPVAINDNDELIVIGSAAEEGALSKPARSDNPVEVSNYTQIFREPVHATRTWMQTATYTRPDDWQYQVEKAAIEHKKSKELSFLHGKKRLITTGTHPRRTTGGALAYITSNVTDVGGAMSESELWSVFNAGYRYGSKEKVVFASRLAMEVVNSFPRGKLELVQADHDKTYGLAITRLVHPHGVANLITHDLLEGSTFGGYMIGLDIKGAGVRSRYLSSPDHGSSDLQFRDNIQAPEEDGRKAEWLEECGLEFGEEKKHFLITNITGAA